MESGGIVMTNIQCQCRSCNKIFTKPLSEYNRKLKLNTPFYCSRNCSARESIKTSSKIKEWTHSEKNKQHIKQKRKSDVYTPFRDLLRRTKHRNKNNNLNLDDIKLIWEQQEGKCALFGHSLILPYPKKKVNHNYLASIDRIDHTQGYTKDNIRIICATANYARNKFTDEHLYEFIKLCTLKSN
jgi:hypothetical protein